MPTSLLCSQLVFRSATLYSTRHVTRHETQSRDSGVVGSPSPPARMKTFKRVSIFADIFVGPLSED